MVYSKLVHQKQLRKALLLVLVSVSDYKRVCMGVGKGILKFDMVLSIFLKKGCFLSFEWLKEFFSLLDYPAKMFLATP